MSHHPRGATRWRRGAAALAIAALPFTIAGCIEEGEDGEETDVIQEDVIEEEDGGGEMEEDGDDGGDD